MTYISEFEDRASLELHVLTLDLSPDFVYCLLDKF